MSDFLDMLSPKELKQMTLELTTLETKVKKTRELMKSALDMSGSVQSIEKYARIMEHDLNQSFENIFGKQRKTLSLEQQRLKIIEATAKAIKSGDRAQQDLLGNLMKYLEGVKQASNVIPTSITKAHGALSLMSGILPTGGATRALNLGMGANNLFGGGMSAMKMASIGAPLAMAGYGMSRMFGGYETYKQQSGDVLSGYGKIGREGMGQINLSGSAQGYSSLERAKLANTLAMGAREGTTGTDIGNVVSGNIGATEKLSRIFGLDTGQVGGMVSQMEQIGGNGGASTERMMAEAVASGVNRARISSFMEKSMHLTEQVYQATGKDQSKGINSLLSQMIANSKDKEYASRYGAEAVGQIGETIRGVGMGGGDLATQGFLSRAFAKNNGGKQLNRYDFMKRAQAGVGEGNIGAVLSQAEEEFKTPEQRNVAMSQMFGINFKQAEMLGRGAKGEKLSDKEIENQVKKFQTENFIEKSPEGKLFQAIAENTSKQAEIGKELLPLAGTMISLQTSIDGGILKIAKGVNSIMDFLGVTDKYEKEKASEFREAKLSGSVSNEIDVRKKYGGMTDANLSKAYKAIEFQDDNISANSEDIDNLSGYGMEKVGRIGQLTKKLNQSKGFFERKSVQSEMLPELEKLKGFSSRLKEEQATTTDAETSKKIAMLLEKMEKAYNETSEAIKKNAEKFDLFSSFGEKSESLNESIKGMIISTRANAPIRNIGTNAL